MIKPPHASHYQCVGDDLDHKGICIICRPQLSFVSFIASKVHLDTPLLLYKTNVKVNGPRCFEKLIS